MAEHTQLIFQSATVIQEKIAIVLSRSNCIMAILDELGINVKSNAFLNSMKGYNWNRLVKIRTTGPVTGIKEQPYQACAITTA